MSGSRRCWSSAIGSASKPVFYADVNGELLFASEMSALMAAGRVPRRMDLDTIDTYLLCKWIPGPRSIYKDVRKLPPAHRLEVRNGVVSVSSYWDVRFEPDESRAEDDFAEELRALVDDSVKTATHERSAAGGRF